MFFIGEKFEIDFQHKRSTRCNRFHQWNSNFFNHVGHFGSFDHWRDSVRYTLVSWYLYRRLFQEGATNISIGEKPTNRSEISRAITVSVVIAFKILTFLLSRSFLYFGLNAMSFKISILIVFFFAFVFRQPDPIFEMGEKILISSHRKCFCVCWFLLRVEVCIDWESVVYKVFFESRKLLWSDMDKIILMLLSSFLHPPFSWFKSSSTS